MARWSVFSSILCLSLFGQPNALFYMTDQPAAIRSFQANASKIDIIVPTVYSVDANGLVWGAPDPRVVETAHRFNVALMPIIVNPGFKQVSVVCQSVRF